MIVPNNIKIAYKILTGNIVVAVIVGILLNRPQFYFGYSVGAIGSMLLLYTLNKEVYEMVYIKEKVMKSPFGYYKRLFIMILTLLVVALVSKYIFPEKVAVNIAFAGLGLISSKMIFIFKK